MIKAENPTIVIEQTINEEPVPDIPNAFQTIHTFRVSLLGKYSEYRIRISRKDNIEEVITKIASYFHIKHTLKHGDYEMKEPVQICNGRFTYYIIELLPT